MFLKVDAGREARESPRMIADYARFEASKSSIHSDIGTYSATPSSPAGSAVSRSPEAAAPSPPFVAGFLRLRPPREPRRERFLFAGASLSAAGASAASTFAAAA